jgi:hypothetical protein
MKQIIIQISVVIFFAGVALSMPFSIIIAQTDSFFQENLVPTDQSEDMERLQELELQIIQLQMQIAEFTEQLTVFLITGSAATAQTKFFFQKPLVRTDRAEDVSQLQEILELEGLYCLECRVTGYFGYWTQAGLMNLQERYELPITGIVDEETRVKLNELYVSSDSSSSGGSLTQGEFASTEEEIEESVTEEEEDSALADSGDNEGLVIVLVGEASVTVEQNATYTDAGATATDDIDGDITEKIMTDNPVNTTVLGTYKVTYNVSNEAGDVAISVIRTVEVVAKVISSSSGGGGGGGSPSPPPPSPSELADIIAPSVLTDLVASNPTFSSIVLSWTAPGDDGSTGTATSYDIRYAISDIAAIDWADAIQVNGEPTPQEAGSSETFMVSGLSVDTYYYFVLRATDEASNSSINSNTATLRTDIADIVPPSTAIDLAASNPTISSIDLSWTATGDNGNVGTATSYDIRYSTSWITQENWDSAIQVSDESIPQAPGSSETFTVSGLSAGGTYYFVIKVLDEAGNESDFSNVTSAETSSASPSPDPVACGTIAAGKQIYFVSTQNMPQIMQIDLDPQDVQLGATQTVTVKIRDTNDNAITQVSGTANIDSGSVNFSFSLVAGTDLNGTWEGSWSSASSICTTYTMQISATSTSGQSIINLSLI